jgi:hypothetical protein
LLIVDDDDNIHHDFRRIFGPGADTSELDGLVPRSSAVGPGTSTGPGRASAG